MGSRIKTFSAVVAAGTAILLGLGAMSAEAAVKVPRSYVNWNGNGVSYNAETGYTVTNTLCAPTAGADLNDNYLLFVLASTKSLTSPTITITYDSVVKVNAASMPKSSSKSSATSSYKYAYQIPAGIFDFSKLSVRSDYGGTAAPTLTVSHGCYVAPHLTVVFNGEYDDTTGTDGYYNLNQAVNNAAWMTICEASTSNCVTFDGNTVKGTTKNLYLTGSNVTLDIDSGHDSNTAYQVQTARFSDGSNSTTSPAEGWVLGSWTTTATFSNGDTAYFVIWNQSTGG